MQHKSLISLEEPFERMADWLEEAKQHPQLTEPTAMSLATADATGMPSVRIILLKGLDGRGLVFYTNSESQKGEELHANPQACINFYWMPLGRQIRASGQVERVSDAEADAYFASRRRGSQIGAWASDQSRVLESEAVLAQKITAVEQRYEGEDVPRPPHWYGWRLIPQQIELWQEGEFRIHHRERYQRRGEGWSKELLYP
jgi:pyridoxamine 5'-phosphate oxidase